MTDRAAKKIKATLAKLIPDDSVTNSPEEESVTVYAIFSRNRPTPDTTASFKCITDILRQRLSEIESGELINDSIVELALSADDWQRIVAGKLKQPLKNGQHIPLDVGVRIKRC